MELPHDHFPDETRLDDHQNTRDYATLKPGDVPGPEVFLIPSDDSPTFDAEYQLEFLNGKQAWTDEKKWLADQKEKRGGAVHNVPVDNREKLGKNLRVLAKSLERLLRELETSSATRVFITSGLRTPRHNDLLPNSKFSSRHQRGLAFDIQVETDEGMMPPSRIKDIAQGVRKNPRFDNAVVYPADGFAHLALATDAPWEYDGDLNGYKVTENGRVRSTDGSVGRPDDLETGEQGRTITASEFAGERGSLLEQMGVRQKEKWPAMDLSYEKTETGPKELHDLRGAPKEGEVDIGDLRFGSVKFEAQEDSDRNQPTAIGQQSSGNVATVGMLRSDMNPVIGKSSSLPETVLTFSLNATQRDDVNKRLRPLVAMQRRLPFCAARSPDLSRMMFGFSASEDVEGRLNEIYPTLNDEQIDDLKKNMPEDLGSLWVPITIRQISMDTQPGASGLFQVHVVMRLANVMPYVPRMQFWKDTESATEWARYVSLRSTQGADVRDNPTERSGVRNVNLPNNTSLLAAPPDEMGNNQTANPHESYPFKKMYRGLLEEFLPGKSGGSYDRLRRQGKTDQLEPIGHTQTGQEVYEPGYPIDGAERAFERYDASAPIGLQYTTINQDRTPESRLQGVLSAYKEKYDLASSLDNAIGITKLSSDQVDGLEETGKVTPIIVGPGRKWGKIMLSVGQTADAFKEVGSDVMRSVRGGPNTELSAVMSRYEVQFDPGDLTIKEESFDAVPREVATTESETVRKQMGLVNEDIRTDKLPQRVMSKSGLFDNGGVSEFQVPDRTHKDIFVKFDERFAELQKGILATFVNIIQKMGRAENWEDHTATPDTIWSGWFDTFISDEIRNYVDDSSDIPDEHVNSVTVRDIEDGTVLALEQIQYQDWVPKGFGSYILTYKFYQTLLDHTSGWEGNDDIPQAAREARKDLRTLLDSTQGLSKKAAEAVSGARSSVKQALKESAEESYGYLSLQNASVESLRVEFSNRYGDREWKGYPNPVTQHLGGNNAEISIEFTTNNQLLLDQLGELKRSQEALSEQRKSHDVVPPLMQVRNAGNILRAHGITQCAYRSHTVNMADNKPGYYKVRLELVQDEATLVRTEISRRIGSDNSDRIDSASAAAPIALPLLQTDTANQTRSSFPRSSDEHRPVGIYDLAQKIYPEALPVKVATLAPSSTFEENRTDEAVGVFNAEAYEMTDPEFQQLIDGRTVESIDIEYHPNGGGTLPEFRGDVRWRTSNGDLRRTQDVDFSRFLGPLLDLLAEADRTLEQAEFRQVVQRVESALSTGSRKGLVLSWWTLAKARVMEYLTSSFGGEGDAERIPGGQMGFQFQESFTFPNSQVYSIREDDVTDIARALAYGQQPASTEDKHQFVGFHARSFLLAATDLTAIFFSNKQLYSLYTNWLRNEDVPIPVDKQITKKKATRVHRRILDQRDALPSTYPDLLMPAINDPAQGGVNVFGPDFPFGPGTNALNEDLHLDNYELADSVRQMTAIRMATIGFDTAEDYVTGGQDNADYFGDAFNEALKDIRKDANENAMENSPFSLTEKSGYFKELVQYVSPDSDTPEDLSGETTTVFDTDAGGPTDDPEPIRNFLGEAPSVPPPEEKNYSNQVFNGQIQDDVRTKDLVQALQISKTVEYVTQVMELAAAADGESLKTSDGKLNGKIGDMVQKMFVQARAGGGLNFSNINIADAAGASEHMSRVNSNVWLKKKRKELLRIYEAEPEVIQRHLGYYDKNTEPRRAKLREKLRDTWTQWKGMRRAFPTYQLVMTGRPGTGISKVVGDRYSWSAVQQIEMRNMASNAGQQCDLVISNMRKRLVGNAEEQTPTDIYGRNSYDPHKELDVGTHMQVYLGYGPDATHLKPFLGRVTGVNIGPVTQVQVSSYSTTMSNAPSEGKGFFVDGWDGQQSLSEAILYTISQTAGLEGLGRNAPGAATDRLGRSARGFAEDDYRASVMATMYRAFGSPGLEWMTQGGPEQQQTGTLLDIASRYGIGNLKDMVLGDPQIYENIWVTSSPESAGVGDMLFAGLSDLLVGGKGWGWMAVPGESAWTQLKKQSKLFSDYVVTSRNYNEHVPRGQQGEHPPRQTLYFGPKGGGYKSSSRKPGADMHQQLEDEEIEKMVDKVIGEGDDTLLEEYRDLFVRRTVLRLLIQISQGGEAASLSDELRETIADFFQGGLAGTVPTGATDIGRFVTGLDFKLSGDIKRRLEAGLRRLFPNTTRRAFRHLHARLEVPIADDSPALPMEELIGDNVSPGHEALSGGAFLNATDLNAIADDRTNRAVDMPASAKSLRQSGVVEDTGADRQQVKRAMMDAFRKDVLNLAQEPQVFTNLTNDSLDDNPLINQVQSKLQSQGFEKSQKMEPVQKHHFGNLYKHVADQQITASDQHPNFANRVTLTFPTEQDNRLAAYVGQEGEKMSYQVQAAPTIDEDYIVERQVPYMNLRYNQIDAAGRIADMLDQARDDDIAFTDLTEARDDLKTAIDDGDTEITAESYLEGLDGFEGSIHPKKALGIIEREIQNTLERLKPYYSRPKYSTCATNILRDSFRHMYTGDLSLMGDPTIEPYHVIHLWDDADQMQGPVEVDGVAHRFDSQSGFYSQVKPKLVTNIRGADQGMDTQWMQSAMNVNSYMSWAERVGSAAGTAAGLAVRGTGYHAVGRMIGNAFAKVSFSAGKTGLKIAKFTRLGGPLFLADLAYNTASFLYEGGVQEAESYVGLINGAMDSNPIMFMPLTYRGEPYTAGLTGATGPSSMKEVALSALDDSESLVGNKSGEIIDKLGSVFDPAQQSPQEQ